MGKAYFKLINNDDDDDRKTYNDISINVGELQIKMSEGHYVLISHIFIKYSLFIR